MHQHFEPEDQPHRSPHRGADAYWYFWHKGSVEPHYYREDVEDEPLFYTRTRHDLDFKCQCPACTRKCTITMDDAKFLRTMGIMWKVPHVLVDGSGRTDLREPDAGEAGRTQEAQNLR